MPRAPSYSSFNFLSQFFIHKRLFLGPVLKPFIILIKKNLVPFFDCVSLEPFRLLSFRFVTHDPRWLRRMSRAKVITTNHSQFVWMLPFLGDLEMIYALFQKICSTMAKAFNQNCVHFFTFVKDRTVSDAFIWFERSILPSVPSVSVHGCRRSFSGSRSLKLIHEKSQPKSGTKAHMERRW